MKHSYLLAGTTFSKFTKMLLRNGFSLYPAYFLRLLFLLQNGIWASLFKWKEKRKNRAILNDFPVPANPLFIVGHWRTGSTFLHQLLSLDNQLSAPTVFQVSIPDSFLVSRKYYEPVMSRMMGTYRPMDKVKIGFDEPQEDEYALIKLAGGSPLEKLIFPDRDDYFLNNYSDFIPKNDHLIEWKREFNHFLKKLSFQSGKRLVLKNPFHSMRIPLLAEMFPDAVFIHIHRHPYAVVPSTQNMWNIVGKQNRLKRKWKEPEIEDVANLLDKMYEKVQADLKELPESRWFEIRFEEFEKDPVSNLQKMYECLNLTFSDEYTAALNEKLLQLKGHKKNKYVLSDEHKKLIREKLKKHFAYYNYEA
ncbi:MAG: sulfotransferase [Bacteroidales bacterium]